MLKVYVESARCRKLIKYSIYTIFTIDMTFPRRVCVFNAFYPYSEDSFVHGAERQLMMQAFAEMDAISDCLVREVVEADAEKLLAYYNVIASEPRNNTGVRHGMIPTTVEEQRAVICKYLTRSNSMMLVVENQAGEIVGTVQCEGGSRYTQHSTELHINLHPDYRGYVLGSLLLQHALDWAASNPEIRRVQLEVLERNSGAVRLYKRMGFVEEGRFHNIYYLYDEPDGEYVTSLRMARYF